mmetsp:Transcript_27991/g.43651  ORF Transcript_27991/g.43651 Transcript_27991/m.43651 type:complete len:169 (-) Transcript_27991:257-763(-)
MHCPLLTACSVDNKSNLVRRRNRSGTYGRMKTDARRLPIKGPLGQLFVAMFSESSLHVLFSSPSDSRDELHAIGSSEISQRDISEAEERPIDEAASDMLELPFYVNGSLVSSHEGNALPDEDWTYEKAFRKTPRCITGQARFQSKSTAAGSDIEDDCASVGSDCFQDA